MEKSLGEIMHGLSEENIAREEELFENMPVFPRISRSKKLTMLLVHRVKSCTPVPKDVYKRQAGWTGGGM